MRNSQPQSMQGGDCCWAYTFDKPINDDAVLIPLNSEIIEIDLLESNDSLFSTQFSFQPGFWSFEQNSTSKLEKKIWNPCLSHDVIRI